MTTYFPDEHDKILRHLFQCQLSDVQIAERMGLHWQTIRRNRDRLNLGSPKKAYQVHRPAEPLAPALPEPTNPVLIALRTLGRRASEGNGHYLLDGVPISAPDLVRAANRKRVEDGKNQIGPLQWRVE
jgi:hypothetical protein